jgi:putative transposase
MPVSRHPASGETATMSVKAFHYRMYATKQTSEKLPWVLDRARDRYNAGVQERRDAYEIAVRRHPNYDDEETRKQLTREQAIGSDEQKRELVEIKEERAAYQDIASPILQEVMRRLKRADDDFLRRVQHGEQPGYPRFQGRHRYNSFCSPDGAGCKLVGKTRPPNKKGVVRVNLPLRKIGTVKLHRHRDMTGTSKTLTIKREGEHFYAVCPCEIGKREPLPPSYEAVGIDLGVTQLAARSKGEFIDHPRSFRTAEKKLAKAQQALAKKKRGSQRRKKAVQEVAKCHRKIAKQRKDFQHKASRKLVKQ